MARVSGYKNQRGSNGTVLFLVIRMLKAGYQFLNVTFCFTAHFTPEWGLKD